MKEYLLMAFFDPAKGRDRADKTIMRLKAEINNCQDAKVLEEKIKDILLEQAIAKVNKVIMLLVKFEAFSNQIKELNRKFSFEENILRFSIFVFDGYDFLNTDVLLRYLSEGGRIVSHLVSNVSLKEHRKIAEYIKRCRNMGLIRTSNVLKV